jgi:small subunit ribosomal protein S14
MSNFIKNDIIKRQLVNKNELKRLQYKYIIKNLNINTEIRYNYINKLNKLNRNSCKTRIKNRCILTGRGKAVYKMFKMSRIKFRELASMGFLPGVVKASW